ncbi:MAG: lamin tail domain-containing protein, partial [Verrucomicrobiota bacterium]
ERRYENRVDEMLAEAARDFSPATGNAIKRFFDERRRDLFETYSPGGTRAIIPSSQPIDAKVDFGEIEFSPSSGNQEEEWVELVNPNSFAIDISGWSIDGGVSFTFKPGTVIPGRSLFNPGLNFLYLSPDVVSFRQRAVSPKGGEGRFVQGPYRGHLSNRGETLSLYNAREELVAETTYEGNPTDLEAFLILSEIMYHPAAPNGTAEWLELTNTSPSATLDLSGARFTRGIEFVFPDGSLLEPGRSLLLVADPAAFAEVHGDGVIPFGQFGEGSRLANGGETLKLEDASNNTLFEFRYDDGEGWPVEADGGGASLELISSDGFSNPDDPIRWQSSPLAGGSPGVWNFSPSPSDESPFKSVAISLENNHLLFDIEVDSATEPDRLVVEGATDLRNWSEVTAEFEREILAEDEDRRHVRWSREFNKAARFRFLRCVLSN